MVYKLDEQIWRLKEIYVNCKVQSPKPHVFALRLLEEAVELCLAAGASVREIDMSVKAAKTSEHNKEPDRAYDLARVESSHDIAGEIADVVLLASITALSAEVSDADVVTAAAVKTKRLAGAAMAGTLYFDPMGKFYRRKPGIGHFPMSQPRTHTEDSAR